MRFIPSLFGCVESVGDVLCDLKLATCAISSCKTNRYKAVRRQKSVRRKATLEAKETRPAVITNHTYYTSLVYIILHRRHFPSYILRSWSLFPLWTDTTKRRNGALLFEARLVESRGLGEHPVPNLRCKPARMTNVRFYI